MKKLETYMMAAMISVGMSGIMAIPSQAAYRTIVIGNDCFNGWNDFSSYCPSPYGGNPKFNYNFNCGFTQNCDDDDEYFPGQRPKEDMPNVTLPEQNKPDDSKPEQNKPGENDNPNQNQPEENNRPNQNQPGQNHKPDQSPPEEDTTTSSYVQQVIRLVNEERAKAGLSPLTESTSVSKAAMIRAKETTQNFSHTRPDGSGFSTVLRQNGISFTSAGENIAYGQRTPQEVMNTWMNSSGHRANILNSNYTTIGVGCYQTSSGTLYWTQLFTR